MILTSEKLFTRLKSSHQDLDIDKNLKVNYLEPDPRYALRVPEVEPEPFPSPSPAMNAAMQDLGVSLVLPPPPPTPANDRKEKEVELRRTVTVQAIPSPELDGRGREVERTRAEVSPQESTIVFELFPSPEEEDTELPSLTRTNTAIHDSARVPAPDTSNDIAAQDIALTRSDTVVHRREPSSIAPDPTRVGVGIESSAHMPSKPRSVSPRPLSADGIPLQPSSSPRTPSSQRPSTSYTRAAPPWIGDLIERTSRRRSKPQLKLGLEDKQPRWEWPIVHVRTDESGESGASSPGEQHPWRDFLFPGVQALTYNTPSCIAGDLAVPFGCIEREVLEGAEGAFWGIGRDEGHGHRGVAVQNH